MVYITGDTHGDVRRLKLFCLSNNLRGCDIGKDIVIILGDAGYNYYRDEREEERKETLDRLGATFFCIHGNHEIRPSNIPSYTEAEWHGGIVYREENHPNLLFAKDGEIYEIGGLRCIVIGGAYSVDKQIRLANGWGWWPDEQPPEEIKAFVEKQLSACGNRIDAVLSHTCPLKYEPREVFLEGLDQSTVDKSTEEWLGRIEERIAYDRWYCGHYHTEKRVDRMRFLYQSVESFMAP